MKISHLLLLLLVVFYAPLTAKSQGTVFLPPLTINNGTSVSSTVPFRGDCVNYGTNSQFIIPFTDLTAMRGGTLTKLTLYSNSQNADWGSARFSIYMAEVTYNEFTNVDFVDWDSMSEVYTGSLSVHNNMMEIVLDSAFTYYGANLMVGFKEVEMGQNVVNFIWKGAKFQSINTAVYSYCYSSYSVSYNAFAHFLPKMTFEYYVIDLPMVEVTEEDITSYNASFSWEAPSSNVTGYKYQYNVISEDFTDDWIELPPTATSVTLENLDPVTEYFFRIKACYNEGESAVTILDFKTECPDYTAIPYYEDFDSYVVANEWVPSVRTLPDCWDYINTSVNPSDNVYPSMHYRSTLPQYAYSPKNSLLFYIDQHISSYQAKPQYVILPAMQNINGLRVKLYARSYISHYTFSSTFKVGVMEETETGPEFISIKEITPVDTYQLYTIDMDGYEGNGERIAIWMEVPNTYYGGVFIDNIEVEQLPMFTLPISSHGGTSGGWYLISSPLADEIYPEDVPQLINDSVNSPDFDLFRFSPDPETPSLNWENWKQVGNHYHFNIEPGRGYLYANAESVNLSFLGTPYSGNGEVTLIYNENEYLGGWNLVGNPFTVPAYIGERAYYRMNENGSGFVPGSNGSAIGVMEGIFVYTETDGEVLTFSTTPPDRSSEQLSVNVSKITRGGLTTAIDRAILRFGEGDELPKFQLNEENAKVYIPQNGLDYAVVNAEGQGEMPVNFSADENGTYTLSFGCENVEFSYLHLFDNKTGIDVDLLSTSSYTFNATTTDYESRFKLVYATGSSIDGDSFSFFNSNGNFSIFGIEGEATLQVLDVMGRMLSTETFSGSIEKRLDVAPGVYFIRLVNGEDVKTQKIVVR
jgi:hypothetical protein